MNWKKTTAAVAIALMLVLAGCSGGTGGGGAPTETAGADTATATEAQTEANTQTESTTQTEESSLTEPKKGTLTGIVDGDTLEVTFADGTTKNISTLGVNAPATTTEEVNPAAFGMNDTAEARKHLAQYGTQLEEVFKNKLVGESVTVVYDTEATKKMDANGNRLAYIYFGDELLNTELLKKGFANTTDTQHEKAQDFESATDVPKQTGEGIWSFSN